MGSNPTPSATTARAGNCTSRVSRVSPTSPTSRVSPTSAAACTTGVATR
ncbi:hypothetical protein [Frigoribacterium sp. ACAM 257]|nr:hypothetical protein [Frigoribacterium sp. ACAM 257]